MTLELLHRAPSEPSHDTPLLFVHGAWHGAWCWDQGFLEHVAGRGYHAYALSLRGHGASANRRPLRATRLADYVDDVIAVASRLPRLPVLIGHSMGGAVVQKALERLEAPAAVLLASMPPQGVWPVTLDIHLRRPLAALKMHATQSLLPLVRNPADARRMFFSETMPDDVLEVHCSRLQDESYAAFLDMLVLNLPRPAKVDAPVLVVGADDDTIFPPRQVAATAKTYGTSAVMFPRMAHDMMLEEGWEAVADAIVDWVDSRALA